MAGEGAEDLAGDGSFQGPVDGLLRPPLGQVGVAVGAGARVVGHPVVDHQVQGAVRGAVAAAGEPVPVGASGADGDRGCAAEGGEGCFVAEPVGVVTGGDQQLGADDGADPFDGQ